MHNCTDKYPVCRGCGRRLHGSPYWKGGTAYIEPNGKRAPANFYGGWVCSPQCDRRACQEQENSMPGSWPRPKNGGSWPLSGSAEARIKSNWQEA